MTVSGLVLAKALWQTQRKNKTYFIFNTYGGYTDNRTSQYKPSSNFIFVLQNDAKMTCLWKVFLKSSSLLQLARKDKWTTTMLNVLHYFSITAHHGLHTELANQLKLLCLDIGRQRQVLVFACSGSVLLDKTLNNKVDGILVILI